MWTNVSRLAAGLLVAAVAATPMTVQAAAYLSDDFEGWALNTDITHPVSNPGTIYTNAGVLTGNVAQYPADTINSTQVVEHKGHAVAGITRFGNVVDPLSGTVTASFDLHVTAGNDNGLVLWSNVPGVANYAAWAGVEKLGNTYYLRAKGDTGSAFAVAQLNTWYRFHITMNLDANDGSLSTYSVVVDNLTSGQTAIASSPVHNAFGAPTQVIGGQFFSSPEGAGQDIDARFDNLVIGEVPEPAAGVLMSVGASLVLIRRP